MKQKSVRSGRERGQVLVLSALVLAVTIAAVGFAVDVGMILRTRTTLQKNVDAMALAGGRDLCGKADCQADARSSATLWGEKNGVVNSDQVSITFGVDCDGGTSTKYDMITVRVERYQPSFFARVVGYTGGDVGACATARKYAVGALTGVRPFGLEDDCIANIDYGDVVTLKFDTETTRVCDALKGNFGFLDLNGTGQAEIRRSVEYGSDQVVCADSVPGCTNYLFATQPGEGTTVRQALQWIETNTPSACDTWDEVVMEQGSEELIDPDCNPWRSDYATRYGTVATRLWVIPIVDGMWDAGGATDIHIKAFAVVFWDGKASDCSGGGGGPTTCDIKARFVQSSVNVPGYEYIELYEGATATKVVLVK